MNELYKIKQKENTNSRAIIVDEKLSFKDFKKNFNNNDLFISTVFLQLEQKIFGKNLKETKYIQKKNFRHL